MRKQYHFWPGDDGRDAWDVHRLIELSRDFEIFDVLVASIAEVDSVYWFDDHDERPTVRRIVDHLRLMEEVDASFPIILGPDSRVMDGMHRVAKALLYGRHKIAAVRFEVLPDPDYRSCRPEDLPYE